MQKQACEFSGIKTCDMNENQQKKHWSSFHDALWGMGVKNDVYAMNQPHK